jgi:hypothetical protein
MANNRHHAPHDFKVGEEVTLHRFPGNKKYPGTVYKTTPTQVWVETTYPRGNTARRVFWGATGVEVGRYQSSPHLAKRKPADSDPVKTCVEVFASRQHNRTLGCQTMDAKLVAKLEAASPLKRCSKDRRADDEPWRAVRKSQMKPSTRMAVETKRSGERGHMLKQRSDGDSLNSSSTASLRNSPSI